MTDPYFRSMVNLAILSTLKEGDALFTNGSKFQIEPMGWWTSVRRRWEGESREKNIVAVVLVVKEGLQYLQQFIQEQQQQQQQPPAVTQKLCPVTPKEIPGTACVKELGPLRVDVPAMPSQKEMEKVLVMRIRTMAETFEQVKTGLKHLSQSYFGDARVAAELKQTMIMIDETLKQIQL